MKHLSQIQSEFLKNAAWEDNPERYQRRYLHQHPRSKKRLRIRPDVQIDQQNPETETIEILKEISKLPYDTFYGEALDEVKDILKKEKPSLYDLQHAISRWYTISANSQYQRQNPEKVEKMRLLASALKDKEQQKLIEEAKRQTGESLTADDEKYLYSLQQKDPIVKDLADDILQDVREKGIGQEDDETNYEDKATDVTQKWINDVENKIESDEFEATEDNLNDVANDIMTEIDDGSDEFQNQKEDIEQTVNSLLKEHFKTTSKDLADDILQDVREKGIGQKDEATGVSGEDLESIDLITKDIIQTMKDRRKSTNKMPTDEDIGNEVDEQLDDESTDIKERVKKEVARILQQEPESDSFATRFNEANKAVHPVEKEWHYDVMSKYGYVPVTKSGTGMVRSYDWHNPKTNHKITYSIGVNADYWTASIEPAGHGYWSDLEPFLKKITDVKD